MATSLLHFSSGVLEFHELLPIQSHAYLRNDNNSELNGSHQRAEVISYSSKHSNRRIIGNKVCLLMVPSFMIPCEILRYFPSKSLDTILSMKILRHADGNDDKYLAFLELDSEESARNLIRDFDGQPLSTLEQVACVLYSIKSVHLSTANDTDSGGAFIYKKDVETSHASLLASSSCADSSGSTCRFLSSSPSSSSFKLRSRSLSITSFSGGGNPSSPSIPNTHGICTTLLGNDCMPNLLAGDDSRLAGVMDEMHPSEEIICPVCLEVINSSCPHSFTTACQHTYHIDCISKLEGPQCPVCRFQHDSAVDYLSCCSECGWQGPRPTSGIGMGLGTGTGPRPGRTQTRDRSQIEFDERESVNNGNSPGWRAADDLYMGAAGSSRSARPPALSRDSYSESEYDSNSGSGYAPQGTHSAPTEHNAAADESCDLWVCLVCGFIGCGSSHCNHIRDHYVRHLHAYAMNTENKGVWDFAGDGWVHRLVLHQSDPTDQGNVWSPSGAEEMRKDEGKFDSGRDVELYGTGLRTDQDRDMDIDIDGAETSNSRYKKKSPGDNLSVSRGVHMKLVEIPDPASQGAYRPRDRPLTDGQEELAVNRKLEYAAQHYTRMVTWQLQHNREQHELRLQRLRNLINSETSTCLEGSAGNVPHNGTGSWTDKIVLLVALEKAKLLKQREAARGRLANAEKELDVLKALNFSLLNNQSEWHKRLETAKGNLQVYQNTVIKAANKVRILMQKLDASDQSSTAQSEEKGKEDHGSGNSVRATAPSSSNNIFDKSCG